MHKCLQVSGKDTRAVFASHSLLPIEDGFIAMECKLCLRLQAKPALQLSEQPLGQPLRGYPQKMCVTMSTGV